METKKYVDKINYTPPLLGNGSLSVMLDYCGRQRADGTFDDVTCCTPEICVWWAGRRYRFDTVPECPVSRRYTLIPFGMVGEVINSIKNPEPSDWKQSLNVENGFMESLCEYENVSVSTRAYVHYDYDMLSVKKSFDSDTDYSFVYKLKGADGRKIERFDYSAEYIKNGVVISYSIDGKIMYNGQLYIFSDKDVKIDIVDDEILLTEGLKKGESVSMFVLYCDDFEREDYKKYLQNKMNNILSNCEKAFEENCRLWNDYMNLSYINVGDEKINNVYKTSQYHLKTLSTKWSLPMGINNAQWHGVYFAFDEAFIVPALLSSNHVYEAYKISKFRYNVLDVAIQRVSSKSVKQANYYCETLEDGYDGGVPGYWHNHVFQNVSVVINLWEQYKYTNDISFLKNIAYPIAKHCAVFFMNNMVYTEESGKTILGSCTDLERLGASVKNAYMTTCSAIKLFEVFNNITEIIAEDKEFGNECKKVADELRRYLPKDDEKYIPYPDCKEKSIGVLSGCFPYKIQKEDDVFQRKAIDDFVEDELIFGNMYEVGKHISSWYASWKAIVYANLFDSLVYYSLKQANESVGCFGEMFEINEKGCVFRPWFTTAAGAYIYAANQMLVQRKNDTIYIAPAMPKEEKNFSFSLAVYGNTMVEAKVKDLKLEFINVKSKYEKDKVVKLNIPPHIDISYLIKLGQIEKTEEENIYTIKY